jgi:hypothetical protein
MDTFGLTSGKRRSRGMYHTRGFVEDGLLIIAEAETKRPAPRRVGQVKRSAEWL